MTDTIELETKIAFLEQHLNELSDVVYQQQRSIDELQGNYQTLRDRYLSTASMGTPSANEKPPHY